MHVSLVGMGCIWSVATSTPANREKRRRDGLEYTWEGYSVKVASILLARHENASTIICVNDVYDQQYSIKDDEHDRRASISPNVPNVFMKSKDKFSSASQFKQLFLKSSNKVRLQKLLQNELIRHAPNIENELLYCTGMSCVNLSSGLARTDFVMNNSKADTALLTAYNQLRTGDYSGTVVIDSEDTDVYIQAAYVSHQLQGQLLIKRKKSFVDCSTLVSREVANVLVALHVMTGCGHN